jgi:pimeloyl-ACP methyl ester carboxylesterase
VERLRVHILRGCSHWAQQDQPGEVNRLIKEFLASP